MGIDPVSLAITAALNAAVMGLQMSQKIEGPRLQDLTVSVADYGMPYNNFYGKRRFELSVVYAEPIKERKKKRKTKGGKYNEYTYYGTWASVICDHEIAAMTRLWFDRHLIVDRSTNGPVSIFDLGENYELESSMRLYLGTEDQLPDPRMQATIEAREGAGTCPALRGRAYLFFEDIPLEKIGNRLPQVSGEFVTSKSATYPIDTYSVNTAQANRLWGFSFSPDRSYIIWGQGSAFEVWDNASKTAMRFGSFPSGVSATQVYAISNEGRIFAVNSSASVEGSVKIFSADFGYNGGVDLDLKSEFCQIIEDAYDRQICCIGGYAGIVNGIQYFNIEPATGSFGLVTDPVSWVATQYFADDVGNIWAIGRTYGSNTIQMKCIIGPRSGDAGSFISSSSSTTDEVYAVHNGADQFAVSHGGYFMLVDEISFTIVQSEARSFDTYNRQKQFMNLPAGSTSIWLNNKEVSTIDLSDIRTVTLSNWSGSIDADGIIYDSLNNALITFPQFDALISWRYLDRFSSSGVTLRSIVEDVAGRCGIESSAIDATDLTQTVLGYSWTQGPARDILDPLLELYDCDARPHDFKIEFINRGGALGSTIESEYFVREQSDDVRYEIALANETDLPHRVFLNFADVDKDQQVNSAVARRDSSAMESRRELTLDLTTWASGKDEAQQYVERFLRRRWFANRVVTNKLTAQQLALEPGDLHVLSLDGDEIGVKLKKNRIQANGVLDQIWVRDDPEVATISGSEGAEQLGRVDAVLLIPVMTKGFVLDVPLLAETHDSANPFMYFAAGPYGSSGYWPGADVMISETGQTGSFAGGWDGVPASDAVTWGICQEVLGDAVPDVFDDGNSLNILVKNGTLVSVTEDELLADAALNLCIIGSDANGWEILQYQYAFLESDGSSTISGFIRGVQGTEPAISTHDSGENFILVDSLVKRHIMGASKIGTTDYYRVITQGRQELSSPVSEVAFAAAPLKPLSPAHVELDLDGGSGDWTITAIRRTRVGGAMINGQDVPLSESSASYKAQIMDGTTIVREISAASLSFTYSSADQTTDWGSPQSSLSVRVLQVSPALSIDGFYTAASA